MQYMNTTLERLVQLSAAEVRKQFEDARMFAAVKAASDNSVRQLDAVAYRDVVDRVELERSSLGGFHHLQYQFITKVGSAVRAPLHAAI